MVIKELDMNKINNVFLKLTKEIEELRKQVENLTERVTELENE
jgi:polyhydroxyalkanoate synthesis regulator phasin